MLNIMGILLFGVYQHSHGTIFTPILNKHSPAACYSSIILLSLWIHLQFIWVCRMEALWCCGLWTWKEANCDSSCGPCFRENRLSAVRAHKNIVMYSLSLFILSSSSIPVFSVKYLCLSVHCLSLQTQWCHPLLFLMQSVVTYCKLAGQIQFCWSNGRSCSSAVHLCTLVCRLARDETRTRNSSRALY